MDTILIRKMKQIDIKEVLKIYQEGIDTGMATFQTEVPSEYESI
ncbi:GNAT family N-acetyltransferase [Lysinibacillus xylanilyticus]